MQLKELETRGVLIEKALRGEEQNYDKYVSVYSNESKRNVFSIKIYYFLNLSFKLYTVRMLRQMLVIVMRNF